jgi:hypothetical protein
MLRSWANAESTKYRALLAGAICLAADKVTYDHIWLNKSVPVPAGTFFQFRSDPVPAGT